MEELETQPAGDSPEQVREAPAENEGQAAGAGSEAASDAVSADELLAGAAAPAADLSIEDTQLQAVLEAIVYVTEEPLTVAQLAGALGQPAERVQHLLLQLVEEFDRPGHGVAIREVAGGYKMATKAEHHEAVRSFVKSLNPPLKLSLPALETLAVIAYKQPVTGPEIMEIRGVQGAGVMKTLLERKLIAVAGRKNVIGKPMLYKTTKEFLVQFGLKDLAELPSLKEFEEIRRMAFSDDPQPPAATAGEESPAKSTAEPDPDAPVAPVGEPELDAPQPPAEEPDSDPPPDTDPDAPSAPVVEPEPDGPAGPTQPDPDQPNQEK